MNKLLIFVGHGDFFCDSLRFMLHVNDEITRQDLVWTLTTNRFVHVVWSKAGSFVSELELNQPR